MEHTGPAYPNPSTSVWRHESERGELVERIIELDRRCRQYERIFREMAEQDDGDRSLGAYIVVLQERIVALEANIEKLTRQRGKGKAA